MGEEQVPTPSQWFIVECFGPGSLLDIRFVHEICRYDLSLFFLFYSFSRPGVGEQCVTGKVKLETFQPLLIQM